MKNKIIDAPIIDDIQDLMTIGESIVWQDVPKPDGSVSTLEMGDDPNGVPGARMNAFGVVLVFFGLSIYAFINFWIFSGIILLAISLGIFFIPEILKKKRKENTKYYITTQRIIFQLWWYGKKSIHQIPFSNLRNMTISEVGNKKGIIYFIVKDVQQIDFNTYAFKDGDRRHQPTFEMIDNVNEVAQLIRESVAKNKK